jgi:hypothetical protein
LGLCCFISKCQIVNAGVVTKTTVTKERIDMTNTQTARTHGRISRRVAGGLLALSVVGGAAIATITSTAAQAAAPAGPYHVVGSTGLYERSAPASASTKLGTLSNGTTVYISCQAQGISYSTGGSPATDSIWDQLTNGDFVADYWVSTPYVGKFSPNIPRCGIAQVSVWNENGPGDVVQVCGTNQQNKSDCTPQYVDSTGQNEYFFDYWFKGPVRIYDGNGDVAIEISGCAVPAGYSSSVYTCAI